MMNNKPPFEQYNGPVDSPDRYVDFCIYQGRQTGKTYKLLMSIPNEPIVIVVHRNAWAQDMLRTLKQLRPDYNINNITFVRYGDANSEEMRGRNRPIYVDNAVLDMVQVDYVRKLNRLYGVTDETKRLKDRIKELEAELGRYRAKEDFLRGWYDAYSEQRKKDFDRDRGDD